MKTKPIIVPQYLAKKLSFMCVKIGEKTNLLLSPP